MTVRHKHLFDTVDDEARTLAKWAAGDGESVISEGHPAAVRSPGGAGLPALRAADGAAGGIFRLAETIVAGVYGKCAVKPNKIKFKGARC